MPEAESIVVLCCDDDTFHSSVFEDFHPLLAIQIGRIEAIRIFLPGATLFSGERVHVEVNERAVTQRLPRKLLLRWYWTEWFWGRYLRSTGGDRQQQEQDREKTFQWNPCVDHWLNSAKHSMARFPNKDWLRDGEIAR